MKYKFSFKLNDKDYFYSSLYYSYFSISGIFNLLFTVFAIVALVYTNMIGIFNTLPFVNRAILILFCFVFTVIQPIVIYIKILIRLKKYPEVETHLEFFDDKYTVEKTDKKVEIEYNKIVLLKKYNKVVILYYNSIQGQLIPDRVFNNNKNEFCDFIQLKRKEYANK